MNNLDSIFRKCISLNRMLDDSIACAYKTISKYEKRLSRSIKGKLRIQNRGNYYGLYHRLSPSDPNGKYINKQNIKTAKDLAQKEYMINIVNELKTELDALNSCADKFHPERLKEIYDNLDPVRQKLVTPMILSDEEYIAKWYESKASSKKDQRYETNSAFCTSRNEYVRSKSEVLIANAMVAKDVPYCYEQPIILKNGQIVYPDFCCLNVRTRQEVYWEHLGMLDNPEYASNAAWKLTVYSESGYTQGNNLIMTFETKDMPLDTRMIDRMIDDFLK